MIRVLLADDEPMIPAGVHTVLSTDPAVTVVAQARDGREAIALAQAHRPDVALLDIRMPALDGISAAAEIGRTVPQTAACILTTFGEEQYVARTIGEGIQGFMPNSGDPVNCWPGCTHWLRVAPTFRRLLHGGSSAICVTTWPVLRRSSRESSG